MLSFDAPMPVNGQNASSAGLPPSVPAAQSNASLSSASNAPNASMAANARAHKHQHIWLVTGPAGCGKTTVAEHLADAMSLPYIEGDSVRLQTALPGGPDSLTNNHVQFHTAANIDKMANGIPLTDADRWDWLTALREESMHRINGGSEGVVLTCSALKRKYRDVIRVAAYYDHHLLIHFIYLDASEEVLLQRVSKREGHYMGANMVHSQFDILERPSDDETDVISVDVSRTLEEVKQDALSRALKTLNDDQ